MTKETQTAINNPQLFDSSSKLIFGDNILSAQFFRDYADMEILRNIKPEDVEDVSNRYVPLFGTERVVQYGEGERHGQESGYFQVSSCG